MLELQPEYAEGSTVSSAVYDLAKYGFDVGGDGENVYLPTVILTDLQSSYGTFLSDGTRLPPNSPRSVAAGTRFYLATVGNLFEVVSL